MKAVVTGASGFVGSHLTDRLLQDGHEVVGLDRFESPNLEEARNHQGFSFIPGDVRDPDYVDEGIAGGADVVFHLAAVVGVRHYLDNPLDVVDINVIGTRNVLMSALSTSTRVLLASTSEIYGKNPKIPWSEDDDRVLGATTVDRWSYSTSKAASEHLALSVHRQKGLPVTIVRYFNAYGPRQAPIYVVSRSVHRALNGLEPLVYDGGTQTRCFTYIDDVIGGTLAAATDPAGVGEVFNIGNSTETTVAEVTRLVIEATGAPEKWSDFSTEIEYGSTYQDIIRRVPDTTKAARVLDWAATTELAEGIDRTVAWATGHPEWLDLADDTTASAPATTESEG